MRYLNFNGGCFLNDPKSKKQVLFSYLHYGGLIGFKWLFTPHLYFKNRGEYEI